jgi:hypothetical protein
MIQSKSFKLPGSESFTSGGTLMDGEQLVQKKESESGRARAVIGCHVQEGAK